MCYIRTGFQTHSAPLSHLARPFKYDSSIVEHFVQTSEKVKLRKRDLEKWVHASEQKPEARLSLIF